MTEHMLKECAKEICGILETVEQKPLQAVRKKFSQQKHHGVAKLNFAGSPGYTATGAAAGGPPALADEAWPRTGARRPSVVQGRRMSGMDLQGLTLMDTSTV